MAGGIETVKDLMHADDDSIIFKNDNRKFMLTTKDNPYDPWTQWPEWFAFDYEKGYHSSEYLARIAIISSDMTDEENTAEIERAIEEIIRIDPFDLYTKAYEPDK